MRDRAGRLRLYRGIAPPNTDRLGFVGFRQVFNNIMGVELTAHWLASYFQAALRTTPTEQQMQDAIDARLAWQEQVLPGGVAHRYTGLSAQRRAAKQPDERNAAPR